MADVSFESDDSPGMGVEAGQSLPQIFYNRVVQTPETAAIHEVEQSPDGVQARPVSYGELYERGQRAAAQLAALGVEAGDRVVVMVKKPSSFLAYFFGAMGLGAVPVPLPPVGKVGAPAAFQKRIEGVKRDCSPRVLVAENVGRSVDAGDDAERFGTWLEAEVGVSAGEQVASLPELFDLRRPLHEIAYLQYTSGSTGSPRGVIVTQRNLVSNLQASTEAGRFTSRDRCLSWLPLYHDMGLIGGPLLGIFLGAAPYLMDPMAFVTNPVSWLQGIDRFKATFTVAPNFAYSIVAHKFPDSVLENLDLSSLRLAFNGGEPIDHETVELFLQRCGPRGFRREAFFPVYGLAEATLAVSFPDPEDEVVFDRVDRRTFGATGRAVPAARGQKDAVTFVGVGKVVPGHQVVIRDRESTEPLPERAVGEICVRGPSVSPGYFGETDPAMIEESVRQDLEVATGDLGYVANGELFVVDRIKDLIIVAGSNYVPSDIEREVARAEGIRRGGVVATGVPGPYGTDLLHLVAEVDPKSTHAPNAMRAEIAGIVRANFNLAVSEVLLVPPNSIPKTSSGKIQRHRTREMVTDNRFSSIG